MGRDDRYNISEPFSMGSDENHKEVKKWMKTIGAKIHENLYPERTGSVDITPLANMAVEKVTEMKQVRDAKNKAKNSNNLARDFFARGKQDRRK